VPRFSRLWRNLFQRARVERDLDAELRTYVELLADEKVEAGLSRNAARREALAELGGLEPIKERVRDVRAGALVEQIAQDISYGARMLRKHAAFTAVCTITLALGVGANSAVFSIVDTVVFRPLPYSHPDRLLKICGTSPKPKPCDDDFSAAELDAIRSENRAFEAVAADDGTVATALRADGSHESIGLGLVTANWLSTLGVTPILGRDFLPDEEQRGRDAVLILTHEYWRGRFNSDPQAIGRTIVIDNVPHTIVGVLPPNVVRFYADVLKPLVLGRYTDRSLDLFGRLRDGAAGAQARAQLGTIAERLAQQLPSTNRTRGFDVTPLGNYYAPVGEQAVRGLLLTLGAVTLVLLIACANVSSLLLARAGSRRRESFVRAAIGASRARLVGQFLIESLLLFAVGGAAGMVVARLSLESLQALAAAGGYLPNKMELVMDARVVGATFAVVLVTGLVFGLAPALQTSNVDLASGLRDSTRTATDGKAVVRRLLIVAQLALSLMLLAGFGLLARSFGRLYAGSGGFNPEHVLVTATEGSRSFPDSVAFWTAVLDLTRRIPGVTWAAVTSRPPVHRARRLPFFVEGTPTAAEANADEAGDILVSADYFTTLGIPVLKGRAFTAADGQTSRPVAIISESVARRAFVGQDPIGRRLTIAEQTPRTCCFAPSALDGVSREVVGVVGDVRQANLDEAPAMTIYRPFTQIVEHDMYLIVRAGTGSDASVAGELRSRLASPASGLPHRDWNNVETMATVIHESDSIRLRRFVLILLGAFAAIALVLAAVGVYGVASSSVAQRTRDIGVRMALGASGSAILRSVMGELVALALAGVAAGTAGMIAVTRIIRSMLFGVAPTDAVTYGAVAAVLWTIVLLAAYAPARRAVRVDPLAALRTD
jgi:putative ABC transport system permease protein